MNIPITREKPEEANVESDREDNQEKFGSNIPRYLMGNEEEQIPLLKSALEATHDLSGSNVTDEQVIDFLYKGAEYTVSIADDFENRKDAGEKYTESAAKIFSKGTDSQMDIASRLKEGEMDAFSMGRLRDRLRTAEKYLSGRGEDTSGLKDYIDKLEEKRRKLVGDKDS